MAIQTEKAYVLRTFNLRETSKIASLYTQGHGKIKGIFKGIRAGKKNLRTTLDCGGLNEVVFYPSAKELWLVSYADELVRPDGYGDLGKIAAMHYMLELVDKVMPLHLPSVAVFDLIAQALLALKMNEWENVVYIFQARLLGISGFKPSLTECVRCGTQSGQDAFFSSHLGGVICVKCRPYINEAFAVSAQVLSSLLYVQRNDFFISLRLKPDIEVKRQMRMVLNDFFAHHTNMRFNSLKVMSMV